MKLYASPKLPAYAALAALGCLAGLALERPEPVLLGAPFLLALAIGAALPRPPTVAVASHLENDRVVEGDTATIDIDLEATAAAPWLEVRLPPLDGLTLTDGMSGDLVSLTPGVPHQLEYTLRCRRWGGYLLGRVFVRTRDTLGFFVRKGWAGARHPLRVYPEPATLRAIVHPAETQIFAGNERSRATGEGIEFADIRPFMPGDRLRRINWRLTTRLGEPHVNELHRERNTDIVLFLDTFAEVRHGDDGTRFQAVRAAAALADRYLERRDRIGLISFGGLLHWLTPAMGITQRYRIIESLIETDIVFSYAWKKIAAIPPRVLPPKALVIAITPLLDERAIAALLDLRGRHFDLVIFEVSPAPFVPPLPGPTGDLAVRIWQMDREVVRDRFQRLGVAVTAWEAGQPLEQSVQEVQLFRRFARLART